MLYAIDPPEGNEQRDHHGKPRVDGSGNEVGGEDGAVPSGNEGQGEVPGYDAVDGNHQGSGQSGEKKIGRSVVPPLLKGVAPVQGEEAVNPLPDAGGTVPHHGQVRDHARVPEKKTHGEVGGDGDDVKDQGRLEVRPEVPLVGVGQNPVDHPDPAQVDQGKEPGGHDGENGHGFGASGDGRAPGSSKEVQNGGNQGPGVGDSHPKHEVDEISTPHHRMVDRGNPQARGNLVDPAGSPHHDAQKGQSKKKKVPPPGVEQGTENIVVDPAVAGSGFRLQTCLLGSVPP